MLMETERWDPLSTALSMTLWQLRTWIKTERELSALKRAERAEMERDILLEAVSIFSHDSCLKVRTRSSARGGSTVLWWR